MPGTMTPRRNVERSSKKSPQIKGTSDVSVFGCEVTHDDFFSFKNEHQER